MMFNRYYKIVYIRDFFGTFVTTFRMLKPSIAFNADDNPRDSSKSSKHKHDSLTIAKTHA